MSDDSITRLADHVDAVLLDVGGTLVDEAPAGTAVADLRPEARPGVADALDALAGRVRVAAVTNTAVMGEADVRRLLDTAGLGPFEVVVTSADVGAAKPDPAPLHAALSRLAVAPGRALYVGDRASDRDAAEAAGTAFSATDRGLADALERAAAASGGATARALAALTPVDDDAAAAARARQDQLTKPPGSLGRVEDLGVQLAAIAGRCPPPVPQRPVVAVFAADHGVVASGVTPWPQEVTAQMVANFVGGGAAINVFARQVGATVQVVDVGVAGDVSSLAGVEHRKVRAGTADLAHGPAMSVAEARAALDVGADLAARLLAAGHDLFATGDMGIGNTTASAAVIAASTRQPADAVTGRGTGIDDAMLAHKTDVVAAATARVVDYLDPVSVIAEVGGLEIAALAGYIVGAAAGGCPVLIDGVIAAAALLLAERLAPGVASRCIAGHRSTEPGATVALRHLGLEPVLDLGLRLGEGTGACLAVPVVGAAARVLSEMATFAEAAVADDPVAGG
ncbi:MAG TPA: nicotinate-nucleotide--dimethylbenzimidazole phosphoribosyltransferase [Acidimicrobiia bacterium]|nr:nicotinate-nucleotide--dimethylbenzimidazole phosphoribosyltransferase [Acidimicrobiia bacterium]